MFAYDNDGSSGHGWRLDLKICEVFALTARALCGSISLQIEIDSHNTSQLRLLPVVILCFRNDICKTYLLFIAGDCL